MKVVFNGMFQDIETGCKPCGTARKSRVGFLNSKSFILPSGITKDFHINTPVEVSEVDGNFLLSYSYTDKNGLKRDVFSKVD